MDDRMMKLMQQEFQRVRLAGDGFRRSLGLGLWISKDEAWWIDWIGGFLRLRLVIDSKRYGCANWARRGECRMWMG